ncbi:MAG TPA: alkaline phosphatase D family protein [Chthoniobacteraceae bacterium]
MRLLALFLAAAAIPVVAAELPERIAFGSCAHQDRPQPMWETMIAQKPDLFLLIGDNIYGDTVDMDLLRAKYGKLGAQPGYQKLLSTCPLLATWDDHDFGRNDVGSDFPMKKESQQVFLNFFGVPLDSPRRTQEGVHSSAIYESTGRRLQVILLDTRYHRSKLRKIKAPEGLKGDVALPSEEPNATILGDLQWRWLEEQLRQPADVRIIASSIQVIPEEHRFEKWANFPRERERLFRLIGETKANGVIFISGDRHMAEISRLDAAASAAGYPIYDVTSSGLTHAGGGSGGELNRHRISASNYQKLNAGLIEIGWSDPDPEIRLSIIDLEGNRVLEQKLRLSELRAN